MSGVIPQVAALMGPCAAGTAYIPGLADFVPMVKGRGSMALAGPHLVRAAIGEDVTQEELGGSRVHCRKSGVGDLEVGRRRGVHRSASSEYLSFFPSHCEERAAACAPVADPVDRMDEELLDVLPESNRKPYDMYDVIRRIVDDGEWLDLKPQWAKTIITCLARMGGRPVGIVANQPRQLGGILDNDSADKAARFVNLCNAFGIPLVFLHGRARASWSARRSRRPGIIRHGAKMLYAVANATVPKITVVLRKAYGAGYYVMNGRAYEPDLIVAWPSAEISVMGAEGAVEIVIRKQVEEAEDPAAKKAELIEAYRKIIDVYIAAGNDMIDDVIDPRETRPTIIRRARDGRGQARRAAVEAPRRRAGVALVPNGLEMMPYGAILAPSWNLTPYVETLRRDLAVAAEAGGEDARALAERLTAPLEASIRLMLLDALSAAADDITRELAPGSVELRLRGGEPEFVVAGRAGATSRPPPTPPARSRRGGRPHGADQPPPPRAAQGGRRAGRRPRAALGQRLARARRRRRGDGGRRAAGRARAAAGSARPTQDGCECHLRDPRADHGQPRRRRGRRPDRRRRARRHRRRRAPQRSVEPRRHQGRRADARRVRSTGHLLVKTPKLRSWLLRSHGGSVDVTVELPAGSHRGTAPAQLTDFRADGRARRPPDQDRHRPHRRRAGRAR